MCFVRTFIWTVYLIDAQGATDQWKKSIPISNFDETLGVNDFVVIMWIFLD